MTGSIIHGIDIILWCLMAASTAYILIFAIASMFRKNSKNTILSSQLNNFLILFPAYQEDNVILQAVQTFLQQDYPTSHYTVAVISDHMQADTNHQLASLPIILLQPQFTSRSKAKALQYAIANCPGSYDTIVILDADDMVKSDFLTNLNHTCNQGYEVSQ